LTRDLRNTVMGELFVWSCYSDISWHKVIFTERAFGTTVSVFWSYKR